MFHFDPTPSHLPPNSPLTILHPCHAGPLTAEGAGHTSHVSCGLLTADRAGHTLPCHAGPLTAEGAGHTPHVSCGHPHCEGSRTHLAVSFGPPHGRGSRYTLHYRRSRELEPGRLHKELREEEDPKCETETTSRLSSLVKSFHRLFFGLSRNEQANIERILPKSVRLLP